MASGRYVPGPGGLQFAGRYRPQRTRTGQPQGCWRQHTDGSFDVPLPARVAKGIAYVKPALVAEVRSQPWTRRTGCVNQKAGVGAWTKPSGGARVSG